MKDHQLPHTEDSEIHMNELLEIPPSSEQTTKMCNMSLSLNKNSFSTLKIPTLSKPPIQSINVFFNKLKKSKSTTLSAKSDPTKQPDISTEFSANIAS